MMLCLGFALLRMPTEKFGLKLKTSKCVCESFVIKPIKNEDFSWWKPSSNEGLLYICQNQKAGVLDERCIQPLDIVFIDMYGQVLDNVPAYPLREDVITHLNAMYAIEIMVAKR